jgi:hypothetical protein
MSTDPLLGHGIRSKFQSIIKKLRSIAIIPEWDLEEAKSVPQFKACDERSFKIRFFHHRLKTAIPTRDSFDLPT